MDEPSIVEQRVLALFRDRLHIDVPATDVNLFDSGVLDSLRLVDLLLYLERDLGLTISFDDVDLERFQSVARIAVFVAERSPDLASNAAHALAAAGRRPA